MPQFTVNIPTDQIPRIVKAFPEMQGLTTDQKILILREWFHKTLIDKILQAEREELRKAADQSASLLTEPTITT